MLRSFLGEITAALSDPGTQWMVLACAGLYLVGFLVLRSRLSRLRWSPSFPSVAWLAWLMLVAALAYAVHYAEAVRSTQALTLVGAAMVGQGEAFFQSRKQNAKRRNGCTGIVLTLIILLAVAAVWQGGTGHLFQYRGQPRWSGPWDNPNTFGVLMGVGFVLAVGSLKSRVQSLKSRTGPESEVQSPMSEVQSLPTAEHPTSNAGDPPSTLIPANCMGFFSGGFCHQLMRKLHRL